MNRIRGRSGRWCREVRRLPGVVVRLTCALTLLVFLTGCPNQNTGAAGTSTGKAGGTGAALAGSNRIGGSATQVPTASPGDSTFITVTKVVRSNLEPNSLLELIGQNGEIGTQCPSVNDCRCVFNWTETTGLLREAEQTPSRVETNLLRCLFTQVTPDVSFFDVRIRILAANLTSNTTRIYMPSTNPSLDPTVAINYLPVRRYQCRDIIGKSKGQLRFTSQRYQGDLHDPALWDLSFAFNFFTTSFGRDYGAIPAPGVSTVPGYECPLIPNDPTDPLYDLRLFSEAGIDLNRPERTDISAFTGDRTIYPPDDNLNITNSNCPTGKEATCEKFLANRSDFYLASFRSGVFKEPACVFHRVSNFLSGTLACTVDTSTTAPIVVAGSVLENGGGRDIIGFAALPDQNQRCPDTNVMHIPAGKKWAKVWQFRTSFQQRTFQDIINANDIGDLFCTTREKECRSTYVNDPASINSVCYNTRNPKGQGLGVTQSAQTGPAFSGANGFGNCNADGTAGDGRGNQSDGEYNGFDVASHNTACKVQEGQKEYNCCLDLNYNNKDGDAGATPPTDFPPSQRPANFSPGGQYCNPALIGAHDASSITRFSHTGGEGGLGQDVWLVGSNGRGCIEADTDVNGRLHPQFSSFPPANPNPFTLGPRNIDGDSRYDIVYVVTPERVNFEDMQDPQTSSIAKQYTPRRLKPGSANEFQVYQLYSGSQNNSDPALRYSKFPLCVLQDAQQGVGP